MNRSDFLLITIEIIICIFLIALVVLSPKIFLKTRTIEIHQKSDGGMSSSLDTQTGEILMPRPTPTPILEGTLGYVPPDSTRWIVGDDRNYPQIRYQWVQVQQ